MNEEDLLKEKKKIQPNEAEQQIKTLPVVLPEAVETSLKNWEMF